MRRISAISKEQQDTERHFAYEQLGGGNRGRKAEGQGSEAAVVEVGGSKQRMAAECCPLLCGSDKDRLAPQVSSVRGSQARGQERCMNKPAYKHLIITQAEEAL